MSQRIYFSQLDCYKNADEKQKNHPLMTPSRFFDLSRLPTTDLEAELREFITYRGQKLSPLSIKCDLPPYKQLCRFLSNEFKELKTFKNINLDNIVHKAKVWLTAQGKNITQSNYKVAQDRHVVSDADLIKYIKKIYKYVNAPSEEFTTESDIWFIKNLPFAIRKNPVRNNKTICFSKIEQDKIKNEVKEVMLLQLSHKALGTIIAELGAVNRFSTFLASNYPDVQSFHDMTRDMFELYLIHTNTEATGRKSYTKELYHLKTVVLEVGKVLEYQNVQKLFDKDDIANEPMRIPKVYSKAEIKRLDDAIVKRDPQIARAFLINQIMGFRISETLTLKQNSLFKDASGHWGLSYEQIKTNKINKKYINETVMNLFVAACNYTNQQYGDQEYVFVNKNDPKRPMQYETIQYHLMAMITKDHLVDDCGERFGVGNQILRHCFATELTEQHVDDFVIAQLLGHANTSSIHYYRKVHDKTLRDETTAMRQDMNEIIKNVQKGW